MSTAYSIISSIQKFSWILIVLILLFGWTSPILMLLSLVCMVGPVIFSFFYGRAWCGNFCPRGSFSGTVLSILSPTKEIPKVFKSLWLRIVVFAFIMMLFVYGLNQPHPSLTCLGSLFIKMMAINTIIQICLAVLIHPFAWCALCPMGTAAAFISKLKGSKVSNIYFKEDCTSCGSCTKNCPMQIDIPSWNIAGEIKDIDCLKCRKCIEHCPKKSLEFS